MGFITIVANESSAFWKGQSDQFLLLIGPASVSANLGLVVLVNHGFWTSDGGWSRAVFWLHPGGGGCSEALKALKCNFQFLPKNLKRGFNAFRMHFEVLGGFSRAKKANQTLPGHAQRYGMPWFTCFTTCGFLQLWEFWERNPSRYWGMTFQ